MIPSTKKLLNKISELEIKLLEAEETIEAIKYDKIDALVISTSKGEQIYTLSSAERPYRIFLEQMNEGAVTLSNQGIILFSNKRFADLLQISLEHLLGSEITKWVTKSDIERLNAFLALTDETLKEEINFVCADESFITVYLSKTTLNIDDTDPVICVVATDLTEKKRSEEILADEKLARSILEQAGEAIVVCDDNFKIIRASKASEELSGEPVLYHSFDSVFPLYDENNNPLSLKSILLNLNGRQVDTTFIKNKRRKINLILNIGILSDSSDNTMGYVINLSNITRHIEAEEKLSQSLKEKTILLKEIHHRVKNNLQIISSLLRLQSLYVSEDHLHGILNECQNRINSMALIHQKLYESKSFASISINEYLKELVMFLGNTYLIQIENIHLELPDEDISFTIDTAVPLGLIVNELVTNSFKHGFTDRVNGQVNIRISLKERDLVTISIKDNGKGFSQPSDFYNPNTLGLQLVHSLIEQINGKVELIANAGTEVLLSIPWQEAQSSVLP